MTTFTRSLTCAGFALALALQAYAGDSAWRQESPSDWKVEIYPIFVWAPFLGANATLPQFPSLPGLPDRPDVPGGPARPSTNVSSSFNGAAFFKFRVEKSKFAVDSNLLWAGLSASTDSPKARVKADVIFGQAMAGYQVLPDFWLEGGVRRLALNVGVTILDLPEVSRKPGPWDPLIGLSYRHPIGRSLRLDLHADGGGFGVGSDVDAALTGKLDWRFSKHFGTSFGWGFLHLKNTSSILQRELTISQTLNGPILGLGIFF